MDIEFCIGGSSYNFSGFQPIAQRGSHTDDDIRKLDSWILTEEPTYRIKHSNKFISYAVRDTRFLAPNGNRPNRVTVEVRIDRKVKLGNGASPLDLVNAFYDKFRDQYAVAMGEGANRKFKLKPETADFDAISADFMKLLSQYKPVPASDAGYVEMRGASSGFLCIETEDKLRGFFRDTQYTAFERYSQIEIGKNCDAKVSPDLRNLEIPRKIEVDVYLNGKKKTTLQSDDESFTAYLPSTKLARYETVSFTLGELKDNGGTMQDKDYIIELSPDERRIECTLHRISKRYKVCVLFVGDYKDVDDVNSTKKQLDVNIGDTSVKIYVHSDSRSLVTNLVADAIFDARTENLKDISIAYGRDIVRGSYGQYRVSYEDYDIDGDSITLKVNVTPQKKEPSKSKSNYVPTSELNKKIHKKGDEDVEVIGDDIDRYNSRYKSSLYPDDDENIEVAPARKPGLFDMDNKSKILVFAAILIFGVVLGAVIVMFAMNNTDSGPKGGDADTVKTGKTEKKIDPKRDALLTAVKKRDSDAIKKAYKDLSPADKDSVMYYFYDLSGVAANEITNTAGIQAYRDAHVSLIVSRGWKELIFQNDSIQTLIALQLLDEEAARNKEDDHKTTKGDEPTHQDPPAPKNQDPPAPKKSVLDYLKAKDFYGAKKAVGNNVIDEKAIAVLKRYCKEDRPYTSYSTHMKAGWQDWAVSIAKEQLSSYIHGVIGETGEGYSLTLTSNPGAARLKIEGDCNEAIALLNVKGQKASAHLKAMFPDSKIKKQKDLDKYTAKIPDGSKVDWSIISKF